MHRHIVSPESESDNTMILPHNTTIVGLEHMTLEFFNISIKRSHTTALRIRAHLRGTLGENRNSNAYAEAQEGNSRSDSPLHNQSHAQVSAHDNNPEAHIPCVQQPPRHPNQRPTVETPQVRGIVLLDRVCKANAMEPPIRLHY
jgi:hypothetical protein